MNYFLSDNVSSEKLNKLNSKDNFKNLEKKLDMKIS